MVCCATTYDPNPTPIKACLLTISIEFLIRKNLFSIVKGSFWTSKKMSDEILKTKMREILQMVQLSFCLKIKMAVPKTNVTIATFENEMRISVVAKKRKT